MVIRMGPTNSTIGFATWEMKNEKFLHVAEFGRWHRGAPRLGEKRDAPCSVNLVPKLGLGTPAAETLFRETEFRRTACPNRVWARGRVVDGCLVNRPGPTARWSCRCFRLPPFDHREPRPRPSLVRHVPSSCSLICRWPRPRSAPSYPHPRK